MSLSRAPRVVVRALLVTTFVLTSAVPVSAADITFTTISSPTVVTVGLPVAYPVTITNTSKRTINHVTVTAAVEPAGFDFLFATPSGACGEDPLNADVALCDFGQLAAGQPLPEIIFYFEVPGSVADVVNGDSYTLTITANVGEGPSDNDNASHDDEFTTTVNTIVKAVSPDFVSGHSVPGIREFTTGLNTSATNPHGTRVEIPSNAEVTVEDLPPGVGLACPAVTPSCFGWGSSLDVGTDIDGVPQQFAAGIEVTMHWDLAELPSGMTDKKLRVVHIFDPGVFVNGLNYEIVSGTCRFQGGLPTNMPCFTELPHKLADKDIEATFLVRFNGLSKGW